MLRSKRVLAAIALVAVVAAVGVWFATSASAVAGPGVTNYYSDAKYKTVVGARGTGCCGEVINWGITTKYSQFQRLYCTDVICPF